jgi:hypothetical protein
MCLGLHVKTLIFFTFGAPKDVKAATFLFLPPLDGKAVNSVNEPNNIKHPIQPLFPASAKGSCHSFLSSAREYAPSSSSLVASIASSQSSFRSLNWLLN